MRTLYHSDRATFSRTCHSHARREVYPRLFGCDFRDIEWEDAEGSLDDLHRGIDRVARVRFERGLVPHTIQERFRQSKYAGYRDLTITEQNHDSGQDSEMYKCEAQWFVYGYFTESYTITELVAVPMPLLYTAVARGLVVYNRTVNNGKGQSFISVKFEELLRVGIVALHVRNGEVMHDAFDKSLSLHDLPSPTELIHRVEELEALTDSLYGAFADVLTHTWGDTNQ